MSRRGTRTRCFRWVVLVAPSFRPLTDCRLVSATRWQSTRGRSNRLSFKKATAFTFTPTAFPEAMGPAEEYFGKDGLINAVPQAGAGLPLNESVAFLEAAIGQWQGGVVAKDDLSILAVECKV